MGPVIQGVPGIITYGFFGALLLAVSIIDLREQIIPNRLVAAGLVAGLPLMLWSRALPIQAAAIGLAAAFGVMLAIALLARGGMGGGDVKLAGVIGFYLGPGSGLLALLLGSLIGAAVGILLLLTRLKGRKDFIPYGPFLALGAMVSLLWGPAIVHWYTSTWLR